MLTSVRTYSAYKTNLRRIVLQKRSIALTMEAYFLKRGSSWASSAPLQTYNRDYINNTTISTTSTRRVVRNVRPKTKDTQSTKKATYLQKKRQTYIPYVSSPPPPQLLKNTPLTSHTTAASTRKLTRSKTKNKKKTSQLYRTGNHQCMCLTGGTTVTVTV